MKFVLSLLLFFLLSCNKPTENTETKKLTPDGKPTPENTYPHNKDFFKSHGQNYYDLKQTCLSCHGADGSGGNTPVSCKSCHGEFPHPRNWVLPKNHAATFKADSSTCIKCHGSDLQGGGAKVSCNSCHTTFPHPKGWALPTNHGTTFANLTDKSECLKCHDPNKKEPDVVKCSQCHKVYPHPDRYRIKHASSAADAEVVCTTCHTDYKKYLAGRSECLNCHDGAELKIQWIKPDAPPTEPPPPETPTDPPPPGGSANPQGSLSKKSSRIPTSWQHVQKKKDKK